MGDLRRWKFSACLVKRWVAYSKDECLYSRIFIVMTRTCSRNVYPRARRKSRFLQKPTMLEMLNSIYKGRTSQLFALQGRSGATSQTSVT